MSQSPQEMFERVAGKLSQDAKFSDICQQADMLYLADRFEGDMSASSPIEQYMVSVLNGDWLMPRWYQWYHSITQAEIDRYLLRTFMLFRDKKDASLTTFRPGEQAVIALLAQGAYSPIMRCINAVNPMGILLRRIYREYFSSETPRWFSQLMRGFNALTRWISDDKHKPTDVTVTLEKGVYHIKHGDKPPVTHHQLIEAKQQYAETSWWQFFKKRALRRDYPFDVPTLSRAWDCYWVEQEEELMKGQRKEANDADMAAKKRRDEMTIVLRTETYSMGVLYDHHFSQIHQNTKELETIVKDENNFVRFKERVTAVNGRWKARMEEIQQIIAILKARAKSTPKEDRACQENITRFENLYERSVDGAYRKAMESAEEKLAQNPWALPNIVHEWHGVQREISKYLAISTERVLHAEGNAIFTEYYRLLGLLSKIRALLGENSASPILQQVTAQESGLGEHYNKLNQARSIAISVGTQDFQYFGVKANDEMRALFDSMGELSDISIELFEQKADAIVNRFILETQRICSGNVPELAKERDNIIKALNAIQLEYSNQLKERLKEGQRAVVVLASSSARPQPTRATINAGEIPLEFRQYSYVALEAYKILGIDPGAPRETLGSIYRHKSIYVHPDKCNNNSDAHHEFTKLQWAHLYLTESEDSVLYDDKRHPSLAFMLRNMQETEEFLGKKFVYLEESIAKLGENHREIAEQCRSRDVTIKEVSREVRSLRARVELYIAQQQQGAAASGAPKAASVPQSPQSPHAADDSHTATAPELDTSNTTTDTASTASSGRNSIGSTSEPFTMMYAGAGKPAADAADPHDSTMAAAPT